MAELPDSDDRFQRIRVLFDLAMGLPPSEREALVRDQADDEAMANQVLDLLATEGNTKELARDLGDGPPSSRDRVQSTATGDLLKKLGTAPKLDGERFTMEGEAGRGGMGAILKIHDRFLNRRLAMKVLLEHAPAQDEHDRRLANQRLGRFLEEAQVTSQLDHPGVVPVHELGLDQNGKVWFTMRLVKGRTASEVFGDAFHERNDWTLTRALEVVLKVCDTMAYAHDKGVLHRDLKPSNVMVGRFGEVYVMDWGLAKVVGQQDRHDLRIQQPQQSSASHVTTTRKRDAESDTASSVVTIDGTALGTPSYMPPEQARSEALDERADVYAIGAMMYELVAGRAPYTAPGVHASPYRLLQEVVDSAPKHIEDVHAGVPGELVAVIEKAMARDRNDRYASVLDLASEVRAFLAHRVVKAYRTGALVEMRLWMRRNKVLAASLAAAVLFLAIGVVATTWLAKDLNLLAKDLQSQIRAYDQKVDDYDQLGLRITYGRLQDRFALLSPSWPELRDEIEEWVLEAEGLLSHTDLQERYARLERLPSGDRSRQILMVSIKNLLELLPNLNDQLVDARRRLRWASEIKELTLHHPGARIDWEEARTAIAANPKYRDDMPLSDENIWGLVPIGENPQSKLWEFYDLRSAWDGTSEPAAIKIPSHEADGRIDVLDGNGIVFVLIPDGRLPLGMEIPTDTNPQHEGHRRQTRLDAFFLGKHEVTRGQWRRLGGQLAPVAEQTSGDTFPVTQIDWPMASSRFRQFGMCLPSDLQWEYAIRGGTATKWWTGDREPDLTRRENVRTKLGNMFWKGTQPVGSKAPNPFGLFDMAGNVMEWCEDRMGNHGTERDGDGRRRDVESYPEWRIVRGGSTTTDLQRSASASNYATPPATKSASLGVRAARLLRR